MILDELILDNFGVYAGRQEIALSPVGGRPIILFGGKNGRGKTTFLEALQLCLYGRFASCVGRYKGGYSEYLRQSIHDGSGTTAAIELQFRHVTDGREVTYRLERRWTAAQKSVNENFWVERDGQQDEFLASHWTEVVEGILPRRIADLFFFDGEKVEAYATPESAADLLSTAVHSLLGMDVVDQLSQDLRNLQQRKRKVGADEHVRRAVEEAEEEYTRLTDGIRERRNQLAWLRSSASTAAKKELDDLELAFMQQGGSIFERQEEIEGKWRAASARVQALEDDLRRVAAEEAPLLLVNRLMKRMQVQAEAEARAQRAKDLLGELEERDRSVMEVVASGSDAALAERVRALLEADVARRRAAASVPAYLSLSPRAQQQLSVLAGERLEDIQDRLPKLLREHASAVSERALHEAERDSIPAADAIADIMQRRDEARARLADIRRQIKELEEDARRMETMQVRTKQGLVKSIERRVKDDFELEAANRIIEHAEKVQATLVEFRQRAVQRHIGHIEACITERFAELMQKTSLVKRVSIDPTTFRLTIISQENGEFPAERLSAGERQLLAISILWGLAQASGRRLPTVIDTPLGRLDSDHRQNLVSKYFPNASHQVILLSTDEEITEAYLDSLQASIGRSYTLVYEDHKKGTAVYAGYFSKEVADAG